MINIEFEGTCKSQIAFVYEDSDAFPDIKEVFTGEFLAAFPQLCRDGLTVYIGLGKKEELTGRKLMDAVAKGVRELKKYNRYEAEADLSPVWESFGLQSVRSAVLGIKLGLYEYDAYHSDRKEETCRFVLKGVEKSAEAEQCLKKASNLADSVLYARELVNTPGNLLTPELMAENMERKAKELGVQTEILDAAQAQALGMGAFLAVASSSGNPPKLIVLRYLADPDSKERTALVGKGVTLDTGGYCLKSPGTMFGIKGDMAGGAAVAGAVFALAANKVKTNVVAVIPACENRISDRSFAPGDVIRSMSGKMIEIRNTDCEGRLILSDAVTYAIREEGATRVLDIATLTGAVVGALGFSTAGVLTNSDEWWDEFSEAAKVSGEQYWRLPIFPEYEDLIKSTIADIRNLGENYCGTISAGLFIKAFAQDLPWIHLDIAGTAWVDKPVFEHQAVGATGAGVTTLYDMLEGANRRSGKSD